MSDQQPQRSNRETDLWFQYGQVVQRADKLLDAYERMIERAEKIRQDWDRASRRSCGDVAHDEEGEG